MTAPLVNTCCQFCQSDKAIPKFSIFGINEDSRKFHIAKCSVCSFIYINPRYSERENLGLYEEPYYTDKAIDISGNVRSFLGDKEQKISDHRIECAYLKKHKKGGRILDFGSGLGFFLEAIGSNWEKYAVDSSGFAINNIQDPSVKKYEGTLFEAGYSDNYFDAIYIGHTLDRLTNLNDILTELKRILKADGVILIVTPNIDSLCAKVFGEKYRLLYSNHLVYFSPKTLMAFLSRSGFRMIDVKYPYYGTSFYSYSGFLLGTGKIFLQVILNLFKLPFNMVSPPYWGNIMSVIVSKN